MSAPPPISRLLNEKGRLDYPALKAFAEENTEQAFIQAVRYSVLMGTRIAPGEFTSDFAPGGTIQFNVNHLNGKNNIRESAMLKQVVYPLFKRNAPTAPKNEQFTVGRTSDNEIVIPDYAISRHHAIIQVVNPFRLLVHQLGSTNPILINGRSPRDKEMACRDGDTIQFGRYEFVFLSPTSLYCRLRGIELEKRIEQLVDTLGKADYDALKGYAHKNNEKMFVQLVHNPSLVGIGVFRGYSIDNTALDMNATLGFLPDISKGLEATPMHLLGRSIYPLVSLRVDMTEIMEEPIPFTIGRSQDNDLLMPDGSISNHHAEILRLPDGRYFIKDIGSTNGTSLNGVPLVEDEARELFENDRVKIGRFEFNFTFPSSLFSHLAKYRK